MWNSTIEQELQQHGHGFFQTVGDSMEPLLHNRQSTVVIEKDAGTLRKYDVVLYRRPAGEYVLHRIVKVGQGHCFARGDNRVHGETVPKEWILGVMTGFYPREDREWISCEDEIYRRYLRTLRIRYWSMWIKALPRRICRRLTR